jgi:His/Glu/Gln/Arg/opine family amino acid ABC transporter permease subunit
MIFDLRLIIANQDALWGGLYVTFLATLISLAIGMAGALVVQLLRSTGRKLPVALAEAYVTFFRTTPEMVLIFWAYFCLPVALGLQLDGLWAGCLSLGLVTAAYLAEILRAGIGSVSRGQFEAARSLGLRPLALWWRVILPQALKVMIPPFINYLTELIKNTTLLAAIGVGELAFVAYNLGAQTFRYFEFITAIGIGFFIIIFPISLLARHLENTKVQQSAAEVLSRASHAVKAGSRTLAATGGA